MSNPLLSKFSGTGVALVTPFHPDHSIDFPALERLIESVINNGVNYIVSLGTTGEAITLNAKECLEVLYFTAEKINGRCPLVAGYFGSNYTENLIRRTRNFDFTGIDAIMASSPSYSKPPQEGIFRHYMALADASPAPIIIYNVPGRTSSNVEPETVLRLAHASDRFVAVKEASGILGQAISILKEAPDDFLVLSGDDPLTLPMIAAGAHGVISVIANVYPRHFSQMVNAALAGDMATARQLNFALWDIHPWLYREGNPAGIKAALEIAGWCGKDVRIPLVSLSESSYTSLQAVMEKVPETIVAL